MNIPLDLPPVEFKAAYVLADMTKNPKSRVRTSEFAERMDLSERQARRVLSALAERGIAIQIARGWYQAQES